jgi:GT2 family glycosyltransferase
VVVLSHNASKVSCDFIYKWKFNTQIDYRLIWIDNASTDDSVEKISDLLSDMNAIFVQSDSNLGVIGGRNLGYAISENYFNSKKSEYLCIIDNDQFVLEGWDEHHFKVMDVNGYDVVGVEAWQCSPNFMPIVKLEPNRRSIGKWYNYVGCGGSLIKRKVLDKIGLFDERFNPAYFEDPDFVMRCHLNGFSVGWNPEAKIFHLAHQTLGKLQQNEKTKRFVGSLKKFREKWKGQKMPRYKAKPSDFLTEGN